MLSPLLWRELDSFSLRSKMGLRRSLNKLYKRATATQPFFFLTRYLDASITNGLKKEKHPVGAFSICFVAGAGLEPATFGSMSPTSYLCSIPRCEHKYTLFGQKIQCLRQHVGYLCAVDEKHKAGFVSIVGNPNVGEIHPYECLGGGTFIHHHSQGSDHKASHFRYFEW